jgi:hypothetical protein
MQFIFFSLLSHPFNLFPRCSPTNIFLLTSFCSVFRSTVCFWRDSPQRARGLLIQEVSRSHTTTHHRRWDTFGQVISSSQRPLLDNTHNTHNRQTPMPLVGFEPTISAGERPQTHVLDRAVTGTGRPLNQAFSV